MKTILLLPDSEKKEKKSFNICFHPSFPQLVALCSISPLNHLVLLPERRKQTFPGSAKNPEQSVWTPSVQTSHFHFSFMLLKDDYLKSLLWSLSLFGLNFACLVESAASEQ